jgi:drug/metabolite transporter (DMT)-like permease
MTWLALLIVQHVTIQRRANGFHRQMGRASFALFPFLILGFMMIINVTAGRYVAAEPGDGILFLGPAFGIGMGIAIAAYITLFYLALKNRRNLKLHAGYMLATPLILFESPFSRVMDEYLPWMNIIGSEGPRYVLDTIVISDGLAIIFALAGAAILMGRSLEISDETLIGDLFSVAAGLLYAVYLLTLQGARQKTGVQFGSWSLLVWVSLFGAPVLLGIALALGEPVWPQAWGPVIGLFILSQLVGQGLMVFALKYFPPLVVGLALLTQPAVASIYGWLAFGEVLSPLDIVGMVLVGAALAVSRARAT